MTLQRLLFPKIVYMSIYLGIFGYASLDRNFHVATCVDGLQSRSSRIFCIICAQIRACILHKLEIFCSYQEVKSSFKNSTNSKFCLGQVSRQKLFTVTFVSVRYSGIGMSRIANAMTHQYQSLGRLGRVRGTPQARAQ